jgi:excisionase family DNA binding protein
MENRKPENGVGMRTEILTVEQVAEWLHVTPSWVRAHANGNRRPQIPSIKIGRHVRFRREDVERWLESVTSRSA